MPKNELYNLPPHEDKFLTEQEVRAIISSSQENFTAPATVKTGHWKSNNFISSSTGWKIKANGDCEFNSGTFRGKLIAGSIHIPNETTANSFHTETDGDSYWGCNVADWATDNDNAKAFILKTGNAKFQDITLEGLVILKDLQAGSVVEGEYVNALAVGKLASGTILSKQISLGVTGGSGDAYISGGAGLDYANWTADKGFILGLDDSDSDKAKFFVGDHANNKYFSFDGTNTDATGFRDIEIFTAGENITAGDYVCVKNSETAQQITTIDSYTDANNAGTNYGTSENLYLRPSGAGNDKQIYFDISTLSSASEYNIAHYLYIYINALYGAGTITAYRVSLITTSWNESTITWASSPTKSTLYKMDVPITDGSDGCIKLDISPITRLIANGAVTNYGIMIEAIGDETRYHIFNSSDNASNKPYIVGVDNTNSDGKVYKAKGDDYLLVRNVIGVALENISADASGKIQTGRVYTTSGLSPGINYYVSETAGAIVADTTGANKPKFLTKVGKALSATKLLLDIGQPNIVEHSFKWGGNNNAYYIPHPDCQRAVFYHNDDANGIYGELTLRRDEARGEGSLNQNFQKHLIYDANQKIMSATWTTSGASNNTILTANTSGVQALVYITYFRE